MLEFYSIQDNQKTPEFPEESGLEFIGGLELETFNRLSKFGFIEKEYSFYNDFRWDSNLVGNKIKTLSDSTNSDAQKLLSLLNESAEKKSGIIAFCD